MLTCSEATRLTSEGMDHRLGWAARLSLRMHVLMCGACRRYGRQIRGVERLLGGRREPGDPDPAARPGDDPLRLSPERREAIRRSLER